MYAGVYSATFPLMYVAGNTGSGTTLTLPLPPVPQGFCWYVERMTFWDDDNQTGTLEVYVSADGTVPQDNTKAGRQDVIALPATANDARDYKSPIYVPPGHFLVTYWTLHASHNAAASFQVRVHEFPASHVYPEGDHEGRAGAHPLDHFEGDEKYVGVTPIIPGDQISET